MDASSEIRRRGWTQGSILDAKQASSFAPVGASLPDDCADYVVISHPCDVVAMDFVREPFVELLSRRIVTPIDGNLTFAKNPRSWQYVESGTVYEMNIRDRCAIPRDQLANADPVGVMADAELQTLRRWLSNRYARSAFPDAFNERFRSASRSVTKILKQDGERISGIYLLVDGRELADPDLYEVVLIATMLDSDFDDAAMRRACAEVLGLLEVALDGCDGISVIDCSLRSERELSLSDLRELRRWDYDSLSIRDEDSLLPPEGV